MLVVQNVTVVPGALEDAHQRFSGGLSALNSGHAQPPAIINGHTQPVDAMTNKQDCKVFVGGLSWETTDQRLLQYFVNFGDVEEAWTSVDRHTGRPRGFGFVVFSSAAVADKVCTIQHTIDRREVEAKKAVPKSDEPAGRSASEGSLQRTRKVFVGGLAPSVDESVLRSHFGAFGEVEDAVVMYDHDNKRPRGFGFITFTTEEAVDAVFSNGTMQSLHDKPIEVKRAVPRDQMGPPAQPRGAAGGALPLRSNSSSGFLPSTPRSMVGARPNLGGYGSMPGGAFSPTALAGRSYSGLSLGGLNGGALAGDFSRSGSDLLQQMTALSLAAGAGGQMGSLAGLAQGISQGLAAHAALGSAGSLGNAGLSLGPGSGLLGGSPGQPGHHLGRLGGLGDGGFGSLSTQRSANSAVSPRAAALRQSGLEDAYQSAFALHEQPPLMPHQQQQHMLQSPQHGFPSSQGLGYGELEQQAPPAAALAGLSSALSRDPSGAFGPFTPHKEQQGLGAAPEHSAWSLSN